MISFDKEQRFIVTGASSGLGKGVALLLNELGATVIGIGRNQKRLEETKAECKYPENMFLEAKDLTEDIEGLPQYVKELKNKYGKFQGLVCCAGVVDIRPLQTIEKIRMEELFNIDYYSPIFLTKGFADRRNNMGKGSSIVYISSIAAKYCDRGMLSYSGAKAALIASAKTIGRELAPQGIRVNCVSPSDIITPMVEQSNEIRTNFAYYPLGPGQVDDVANMIVFLLSDKAKWLTTQNYRLDCGTI